MAFFCPIFPSKQNRIKAKGEKIDFRKIRYKKIFKKFLILEYEDSNYYSFDGGGRSLYSSRSMTALNFVAGDENLAESVDQQKSFDSTSSSRMLMINSNFDPTVDDELRVRRGDVVKALYRDRDWIYVVRGETEEGFVPAIFCQDASSSKRPEKSQLSIFKSAFTRRSTRAAAKNQEPVNHDSIDDEAKKSVIREKALMNVDRFLKSLDESPNYARIEKEKNRYGAIMEFRKRPHGKLRAEYKFEARNEDDVSVKEGEILLLLNNDDPDWFWVRREDGAEGFVPSNYVQKINGGKLFL